jgi:threonine synthase
LHGLSNAGKPLLVRYDLPELSQSISKDDLRNRPAELWRYCEFLPVRRTENIVSLGEIMTPLIPLPKLQLGEGPLVVKGEGRLPTGSFKARGICMAISMAKELASGRISADESVVLFNCATGLKYPMPPVTNEFDCTGKIDSQQLN